MAGNVNSGRRSAPIDGVYAPPRRPRGLDKAAAYYWDTVVTELIDKRLVEIADEPAVVEMCNAYSMHQRVAKMCSEAPENTRLSVVCAMWWSKLEKLNKRFGMNASTRRSLAVKGEDRRQTIVARVRA